MKKTALPNTFVLEGRRPRFFTKSLTPGTVFFQEQVWREHNVEYREIAPNHSKLVAALAKGCPEFGIKEGGVILYLGASHGYTPSFVSDMIGSSGVMYCVEFAPSVARDLVFVCEARENMIPILADANKPEEYAWRITGADVVFQDIAQRAQVDIFLKNVKLFLAPGGYGLLALKARSVDTTKQPSEIFRQIKGQLNNTPGIKLLHSGDLIPFEKDHAFFVVQRV